MSESIDEILRLPQRKLVVSQDEVHLDKPSRNEIYILMVEESRGSAGGRAAGSGHRRINRIYGFSCGERIERFLDVADQEKVEKFEIPYSAVAMDIRLSDGTASVVQGVVDPHLVSEYRLLTSNLK
ncbi:MAG TPA: hypothetical protein VIE86_02015 [Nitrososphaera sp.]|jgi:hypothetical protein